MKIKPKIGIVSCSGECCSLGTLSRVATRMTLEELSDQTVTICLPLFLAGEAGEHSFAKEHPTVSVDGCGKLCAMKAITRYSKEPAESVNVEELMKKWGAITPEDRRVLDEEGMKLAERLTEMLVEKVGAIQEAS